MSDQTLTLASVFSDSMVLQRDKPLRFSGTAPEGAEVLVSFAGAEASARAQSGSGREGVWEVEFPPMEAGGPYKLTVRSGEESVTASDILVGEVWIAAGQSNMELPLDLVTDWPGDALSWERDGFIREFTGPVMPEFHHPRRNIPGGRWRRDDGDDFPSFSALGWYFARELRAALGVPVGILMVAVGGSPAESWVDRDTLAQFPEFSELFSRVRDDSWRARTAEDDGRRIARWNRDLEAADPGLGGDAGLNDDPQWRTEGWHPCSIPEGRGGGIVGEGPGSAWIRRSFHATPRQAASPARLRLGGLVDGDRTWINGIEVGATEHQYLPRRYAVPLGVIREGNNELLVRLVSPEGPARLTAGKRYDLSWKSGENLPVIELTGSCQRKNGAMGVSLGRKTFMEWLPVGLFNSRVAPLAAMALRGVIWYQGESNTGRPAAYAKLFRALVRSWRRLWNEEPLPFLTVQLANYRDPGFLNRANGWPMLREAQRECRDVPGTGMVTAVDIGEWNDLHPTNKRELGRRLALLARKIAYQDGGVRAAGPHPVSVRVSSGRRIVISLAGAQGMEEGWIMGFEVGDTAGVWRSVRGLAEFREPGDIAQVTLEGNFREGDLYVRYAWADDPVTRFPLNGEGFPLEPFLEPIGFTEAL